MCLEMGLESRLSIGRMGNQLDMTLVIRRGEGVERLTKKTIGCFKYDLKDHKPIVGEFNDYDTFFNYSMAVKRLGGLEDKLEPIPAEDWHEDDGFVLWWRLPIEEPPYVGNPLCDDFTF